MNRGQATSNEVADSSFENSTCQYTGMADQKSEACQGQEHEFRKNFQVICGQQPTSTECSKAASFGLISAALSQLPLHERENALNEMHGVEEPQQECREIIESKVLELVQQLRRIATAPSDTYGEAFMLSAIQSPAFAFHSVACERFLHSSRYDVAKAVTAILRYYAWKRQLWGDKKLGKEIELDDMCAIEIELLKTGLFQVLPERDRAGRQINAIILDKQIFPSDISLGRVLWYMFQLRIDQPSESMAVWITFHLNNQATILTNPSMMQMYQKALSIFPLKSAVFHHCVRSDTSQFRAFLTKTLSSMDSANKAKTKVHIGPFKECIDTLMSYGIPPHIAPVTEDGRIRAKIHLESLQGRKTGEQMLRAGSTNVVFLPLNSDILFGRGRPIQQTAGNLRLTAIVEIFVGEYHQLELKQDKTALAAKVVQMVKSASGRFLSRQAGTWTEVSDEVAREKVSGLFRTLHRKRMQREGFFEKDRLGSATHSTDQDEEMK